MLHREHTQRRVRKWAFIFHSSSPKLLIFSSPGTFFSITYWKIGRLCPTITVPERMQCPSRSPPVEGILQPVLWGAAEFPVDSPHALTAAQRCNRRVQDASRSRQSSFWPYTAFVLLR